MARCTRGASNTVAPYSAIRLRQGPVAPQSSENRLSRRSEACSTPICAARKCTLWAVPA